MAFTDMNDVEQELGEERPPDRNGNRTFMIIAGILGGIMVLALLCIAGLALFRYLPGQQAAQIANATNEAQATANALMTTQTAQAPAATNTTLPTVIPPTFTQAPTNTAVIVIGPTSTPTFDTAMATVYAMRTQRALGSPTPIEATSQPTSEPTSEPTTQPTTQPTLRPTLRPTSTALPVTGIAEEMGTPGLLAAGFVLIAIIFLMRRLRTAY